MKPAYKSPKTIWLALSDVCNNMCLWCYEKGNQTKKAKHMDVNFAKKVVDTMSQLGIKKCVLIGGEPTLHPEFYKIVNYINERKVPISLVTNGRQFANETNVANLLSVKINNLVISVHGWTKEIYASLAGAENGFEELIKAINLLKENNGTGGRP